jgi:hypothetical protein
MVIATGKVRHGAIEVEAGELPEGATVTVLAPEGDETFALGPEDQSKLLAAVHEADRGSFIPAAELLARIRRS